MNPVGGWQRHLSWLVPLLLIPLSVWIFGLVAMWMLSESEPGPTSSTATWIGVISGDSCRGGSYRVHHLHDHRRAEDVSNEQCPPRCQKCNAMRRPRGGWKLRFVQEGGPRCDASASSAARTQAAQWYERFQCGDVPERLQSSTSTSSRVNASSTSSVRSTHVTTVWMSLIRQVGSLLWAVPSSSPGRSSAPPSADPTRELGRSRWQLPSGARFSTLMSSLRIGASSFRSAAGPSPSHFNAVVAYFPEIEGMTLTLAFSLRRSDSADATVLSEHCIGDGPARFDSCRAPRHTVLSSCDRAGPDSQHRAVSWSLAVS